MKIEKIENNLHSGIFNLYDYKYLEKLNRKNKIFKDSLYKNIKNNKKGM